MEPRIQYAKTSDGVNIAYWALGEGEPLASPPDPMTGGNPEVGQLISEVGDVASVQRVPGAAGAGCEECFRRDPAGVQTALNPGDEISIVPAVAGG